MEEIVRHILAGHEARIRDDRRRRGRGLVGEFKASGPAAFAGQIRQRGLDLRLHPIRTEIIVRAAHPRHGIDPGQVVQHTAALPEQELRLALQFAIFTGIGPVVDQFVFIRKEAAAHRFLNGSNAGQGIFVNGFDGYTGFASGGDHKPIIAHFWQLGGIVDQDLDVHQLN